MMGDADMGGDAVLPGDMDMGDTMNPGDMDMGDTMNPGDMDMGDSMTMTNTAPNAVNDNASHVMQLRALGAARLHSLAVQSAEALQ